MSVGWAVLLLAGSFALMLLAMVTSVGRMLHPRDSSVTAMFVCGMLLAMSVFGARLMDARLADRVALAWPIVVPIAGAVAGAVVGIVLRRRLNVPPFRN